MRYVSQDELRELVAQADDPKSDITLSPWFRLIQGSLLHGWWDALEADKLESVLNMGKIERLGFDA